MRHTLYSASLWDRKILAKLFPPNVILAIEILHQLGNLLIQPTITTVSSRIDHSSIGQNLSDRSFGDAYIIDPELGTVAYSRVCSANV